jgi:hypothetical protein
MSPTLTLAPAPSTDPAPAPPPDTVSVRTEGSVRGWKALERLGLVSSRVDPG